jgi:hypothetical protein
MNATLTFNNGAAVIERPCRILEESPLQYLITFDQPTLTPGGMFMPGEKLMIVKQMVKVQEASPCV